MFGNIRTLAGLTSIAAILLLQGCGKTEEIKAKPAAPAVAVTPAPKAGLTITDNLTAYHAAGPAERGAVIPAILAKVKDEIDKKGKSDTDLAAEILPCMNNIDEQVTPDVRATQPILDLGAVCLAQLGYKK